MIITELYNGQGLGNQLWCYTVTRAIAENNGFDFGIKFPEKFKGNDFLNLDFGKQVIGGSGPEGGAPRTLPTGIKHYYSEKMANHPVYNYDIRTYDKTLANISDNTKIDGIMQDEKYILHCQYEIKEWLKVKPEYESDDFTRDNLCIINFRGGEYVGIDELYLNQKYWIDAINNMKDIIQDMEFMIITDDVMAANSMLPNIDAKHFSIHKDYVTIKNAKYLILSNSSFSFFPAYTSDTVEYIIAPKYWARHNISDGYWATGQNIYTGWNYQDRNGKLFTSGDCRADFDKYREQSKIYKLY